MPHPADRYRAAARLLSRLAEREAVEHPGAEVPLMRHALMLARAGAQVDIAENLLAGLLRDNPGLEGELLAALTQNSPAATAGANGESGSVPA